MFANVDNMVMKRYIVFMIFFWW